MFQLSDQHHEEFHAKGYTVFRGIVPAALLGDLRRECEHAATVARERNGADAQRFQPALAYVENRKPFEEFQKLAPIRDAVSAVLGLSDWVSGGALMAVLIEPQHNAWCTAWHRDWRDNMPNTSQEEWQARHQEIELFNQVNCALYEDSCTWVVPGSQRRADNASEARFRTENSGPDLRNLGAAERERACLAYCESMPDAVRLHLNAGDYCLYRNCLWHTGNYVPYRKRATLHDGVMTPQFVQWWQKTLGLTAENAAAYLGIDAALLADVLPPGLLRAV